MESVDVNKIYKLIKENEALLEMYVYDWLRFSYNIKRSEANDIILLAMMEYPCYAKYCLKKNKLGQIKYLKTAITRYLAYREGNVKAKSVRNSYLKEMSCSTHGDDINWMVENNSHHNVINTNDIDLYLLRKTIYKYLKNQNQIPTKDREAVILYLTTDKKLKDVDEMLGVYNGLTGVALRRFKRDVLKNKEFLNLLEDYK